jgi:hypothetical protein
MGAENLGARWQLIGTFFRAGSALPWVLVAVAALFYGGSHRLLRDDQS